MNDIVLRQLVRLVSFGIEGESARLGLGLVDLELLKAGQHLQHTVPLLASAYVER